MGGFEDKVRGVLSDTMNLPSDFLSMIPQYVAQNPVSLARTPGTRITSGRNTSPVTTVGTTFAAGADILSSPLTFTADGKTDYLVYVIAPYWQNSGITQQHLRLNLDGGDVGIFAYFNVPSANATTTLDAYGLLLKPSSGSHTLNARFVVSAGTGTIGSGVGGVGANTPIFVSLEVA